MAKKETASKPTAAEPSTGKRAGSKTTAPLGKATSKPDLPATAYFQELPVDDIQVRPQTRKTFDEDALEELAQSIREHGVLQPLVIRMLPGAHLLAAGERRLRASKLAGLQKVPCMIRTMTDREFLEIQVLENLQRQDVHPAEEAEAFAKMLANGYTAEELGHKVGRSAHFVAQRAQLVKLIPHWMEKLRDGSLSIGAAIELARLSEKFQKQAKESIYSYNLEEADHGLKLLSAPRVRSFIQREVFIDLHSAAFKKDCPDLNPKAGACTGCAKRTGANGVLFAELGNKDNCLDKACFEIKKARHLEQKVKELVTENPDAVLISRTYSGGTAQFGDTKQRFLGYSHYEDIQDQKAPGVVMALIVDGPDAGHLKPVKLRQGATDQIDREEDMKAQRLATMRKNKIEAKQKVLTADKLYELLNSEQHEGVMLMGFLDKQVTDELLTGVSDVTKEWKQRLGTVYGWVSILEGLEEQYAGKRNPWIVFNLSRMKLWDKIKLMADIHFRKGLSNEYYNHQKTYADIWPKLIDQEELKAQATALVDKVAPAKKEKQGGSRRVGRAAKEKTTAAQAPIDTDELSDFQPAYSFKTWCDLIDLRDDRVSTFATSVREDDDFPRCNDLPTIEQYLTDQLAGEPDSILQDNLGFAREAFSEYLKAESHYIKPVTREAFSEYLQPVAAPREAVTT